MHEAEEPSDRDRWNHRYREQAAPVLGSLRAPAALVAMAMHLPETGVAVDLAGGNGGGALFYAARGLSAVLVDVSDVALAQAAERAEDARLALSTVQLDFSGLSLGETLAELNLDQPPAVISCFHYLDRTLLGSVAADLPPGSRFVAGIATRTNLERNERPSPRFLLEPGELADLVVGPGLDVLHTAEGWTESGQHEAEIVVERPHR